MEILAKITTEISLSKLDIQEVYDDGILCITTRINSITPNGVNCDIDYLGSTEDEVHPLESFDKETQKTIINYLKTIL